MEMSPVFTMTKEQLGAEAAKYQQFEEDTRL